MKVDKSKWELKSFADVCIIKNGKDHKAVNSPQGQYPIYGSGGKIGYAIKYLCNPGTTIIGRKGTINSPIFVNEKFWNIDTAFGMEPKPCVIPKFFFYSCLHFDFKKIQSGAAIPSLTQKDIKKQPFEIPPIDEQQSIATELDAIQAMIDGYKAQIADLDVLAQSIFMEMFGDPKTNEKGWKIFPLGEVCSMRAGKNIKASELSDTFANGLYPCYGGNGLRGYVNHFSHNCKTVIIGRQGALCGNVNIVKGKFYATEHAVPVSPILPQTTEFLYYMLKEYNLNRFAKGAAQPGLSVRIISKKKIPLPPLILQRQFSERIALIETQKKYYQGQLNDAETLMSERMQYYFS